MIRTVRTLTALTLAAGCAVTTLAAPAAAAPDCAEPGQDYKLVPWAQQMLGPGRAWAASRGGGIDVAVLESGVDAAQPRLARHVAAGFDATTGNGPANTDCLGTGTQVAGVIAGQPAEGSGFVGVAPDSTVVPVRVMNERSFSGDPRLDPAVLARAITWAVQAKVHVINVAVPLYADDPGVRAAVASALANKIVMVAAVGDLATTPNSPTPYPAAYDGVLGVGAINQEGLRNPASQIGRYVDVVAPGDGVMSLQRGSGFVEVDGTGVASGFVAGTAALVRAKYPNWSPAEVVRQIMATATPSPGGAGDTQYGRGVVNPIAAVNESVVTGSPVPPPAIAGPAAPGDDRWADSRRWALLGVVLAIVAAIAVTPVAVTMPRGRRRRWRSTMAEPPKQRHEPAEPGPPAMLFDNMPNSDRV